MGGRRNTNTSKINIEKSFQKIHFFEVCPNTFEFLKLFELLKGPGVLRCIGWPLLGLGVPKLGPGPLDGGGLYVKSLNPG